MNLDSKLLQNNNIDTYKELIFLIENSQNELKETYLEIVNSDLKNWEKEQIVAQIFDTLCSDDNNIKLNLIYELILIDSKFVKLGKYALLLTVKHDNTKLLDFISKFANNRNTKEFNQLIIHELVIHKDIKWSDYEDLTKHIFEEVNHFKILPFQLLNIEKGFNHKSLFTSGGLGILFGLQNSLEDISDKQIPTLKTTPNHNENLIEQIRVFVEYDIMQVVTIGQIDDFIEKDDLELSLISSIHENLKGDKPLTKFALKTLNHKEVVEKVFNLCLIGGAYSRGYYGARSRLFLWRIIGGLTQQEINKTNLESLIEEFMKYKCFEFSCDWFINEWFDFGLILINTETGQFGVMAATDTD